jgi:hypothetical protein
MEQNAHFVARHKMREDHGGGVVLERTLHDLARVHMRLTALMPRSHSDYRSD